MERAIETYNLCKKYNRKLVVSHLNLSVFAGEVFGFLGANGAGKTTSIRILSTVIPPSEGSAKIFGYDTIRDSLSVRQNISVIPQGGSLNFFLDVYENIRIYLILKGYSQSEARKLTNLAIDKFDLVDHVHKKSHELSGGLRKRVQIARSLICEAPLIFLDEPTVGLDPYSKRVTWNFIREAKKEGRTIFLTTQSMEEAEALSDRVCFMRQGKAIEIANLQELKSMFDGNGLHIEVNWSTTDQVQAIEAWISQAKEVKVTFDVTKKSLFVREVSQLPIIIAMLSQNNVAVKAVQMKEPTLEEIYFQIMEGD